jgi:hypothetical protein
MLTVLQESHVWDIFQDCYDSVVLADWPRGFLRDNMERYAVDYQAYFISPKMWSILNKINDQVTSI